MSAGDLIAFLNARLAEDEATARTIHDMAHPDTAMFTMRQVREVEAKGSILALHYPMPGRHPGLCGHDQHELPCPTLRILTAVYSDHPAYRQEWGA
jgi:Family of unknown function (DUF6221)